MTSFLADGKRSYNDEDLQLAGHSLLPHEVERDGSSNSVFSPMLSSVALPKYPGSELPSPNRAPLA